MSGKEITNMELLRLATELAYSDYNNRRANLHNAWLADNENMKRTRGVSVPYPPIPPYPTELEIVSRAQKLVEFLNHPRPDLERQRLHTEVKELITDVKQELTKDQSVEEKQSSTQLIDSAITTEIVPQQDNISESDERASVIDKIKNVWR